MTTETFEFVGASGRPLLGRLDLPAVRPQAFAVFAHCFACTKQSVAAVRVGRGLAAQGFGVLRFDFTGLGDDLEHPYVDAFSGNVNDIVLAAEAMTAAGRPPALLIGHSFGGAAVLAAARQLSQVAAIATIGAPFDIEHVKGLLDQRVARIERAGHAQVDLGGRRFCVDRAFLEDLVTHDADAHISKLGRALLVLHAPRDEIVGIENASAIFQAARHPKSFVALAGADHLLSDPLDAEYVAALIAAWSAPYLKRLLLRQENEADPR